MRPKKNWQASHKVLKHAVDHAEHLLRLALVGTVVDRTRVVTAMKALQEAQRAQVDALVPEEP